MDTNLDFQKMQGLVPAIVQDDSSNEILMLGFMNEEAFHKTQTTGYVTFFSRTRKAISITTDCDRDTFLIRVQVEGAGVVCHLGTRSCFRQNLPLTPSPVAAAEVRR